MTILPVDPAAPWYIKAGADALLTLHIGGGTLGMISGTAALIARKGTRAHAIAGRVFFAAMLSMATVGATVAPFLPTGLMKELPNAIAGVMAFYLVLTSWATIRRRDGGIGAVEKGGFVVALTVALAGTSFALMAMNSPSGTLGATPPQAFYVFMLVGGIAAASDLKVILAGGISGAARISRHLWRMCTALTIATGSFFLGQQKFLPAALHGSPLLFVPVAAPLAAMVYWLVRVRIGRRFRARAAAAA
ncbi:MAG: hypothetical protein ACREHE_09285 [Rhizomicrobium sp.]